MSLTIEADVASPPQMLILKQILKLMFVNDGGKINSKPTQLQAVFMLKLVMSFSQHPRLGH